VFSMRFIDASRAFVFYVDRPVEKPEVFRCGLLNVDTMEVEPIAGPKVRSFGLRANSVGTPLYFIGDGKLCLLDLEEHSVQVIVDDGDASGQPIYVQSSNSVLFVRNRQRVIQKHLETGEETCIYDVRTREQE